MPFLLNAYTTKNTHKHTQIAERLYTSGYLSYPRTESSAYPPNFDLRGALASQARHPVWGEYTSAIMAANPQLPKVRRGRLQWCNSPLLGLQQRCGFAR